MAGYSKTPLPKKLGYKANYKALLYNEPSEFRKELTPLPDGVEILEYTGDITDIDIIHIFTKEEKELESILKQAKGQIKKSGMIWISWPKKASKVKTDLTGNIVRVVGLAIGLVDIKVAAVDEIWSGLKFVYRKEDR